MWCFYKKRIFLQWILKSYVTDGLNVFYSVGSSKSKGVITLVSKHLQFKCLKQIKDN